MPVDYPLEGPPQRLDVEISLQSEALLVQVEPRPGRLQDVEQHALLQGRQGVDVLRRSLRASPRRLATRPSSSRWPISTRGKSKGV